MNDPKASEYECCATQEIPIEPEKKTRCTKTKKLWISITITLICLSSIILGLYFGLNKKNSHYNPPKSGVVFYGNYSSSLQNQTSNDTNRMLEGTPSEGLSTQLTFIVVGNSEDTIEIIVIPGIIVEKELRNLRTLDDKNEENNSSQIPFFIVKADTDKGKILSMKASKLVDENYSQTVVNSVQLALVSSKGDKQAAGESNEEICEDYSDVVYCPTYKRHKADNNYVLAAEYDNKSLSKHRRLKESDEIITRSEINIEKLSYINGKTGELMKSHALGQVSIPITGEGSNTQNLTLNQDVSVDFSYSSGLMKKDETDDLKKFFESKEIVDVNLKPAHTSSLVKNSTETDSHGGHRRNLGLRIENKVKVLDVLGMPLYYSFLLEDTPEANFRSSSLFQISDKLNIPFGTNEYGNDFVNKIKKLISLKNLFENKIFEIRDVVFNYAYNDFVDYNQFVLAKLTETQVLIIESGDKLFLFIEGLLTKAQNYSDKVDSMTDEFKKQFEKQIFEHQSTMQDYTSITIEPLNKRLNSEKKLKEDYENELNENTKVLNNLKENTLKNLVNEKEQIMDQINTEKQKFKAFEDIEKSFGEIIKILSDYKNTQLQDLDLVKTTTSHFQSLSKTVGDELGILDKYINSELLEFKSNIDSKVDEINQSIKNIEIKIYNEVTLATDQIKGEIQELNLKVTEIELKIESSTGLERQNLIAQKDALLAQIIEKQYKLENDIKEKKELLENQKRDLEQTLNLNIEEAKNELNSKLIKWKTHSENIQEILSNQLNVSILVTEKTLNQAKSSLISELENLKNLTNNEVNEKKDLLLQSISSIEKQLELEEFNIQSITQLKSQMNIALDQGASKVLYLNNELAKTKEEISEEIKSIKSEIKSQIENLETELKIEVYDIRTSTESDIKSKQEKITELMSKMESNYEEQVKSIEAEIIVLQSRLLNLNTLEDDLLIKKKYLESKLNDIKQDYTYQLYLKGNDFREFYTSQENRVKLIASTALALNESLSSCAKSLESLTEELSKIYNEEIEPYPKILDQNIKKLGSTEQQISSSIQTVQLQIKNISSSNENLNIELIEATTNLNKTQTELEDALEHYKGLEKTLNDLTGVNGSIQDGSFDWNDFFVKNQLLTITNDIEKEIDSVFGLLNTNFPELEKAVNQFNQAFDQKSLLFTTLSRDKSLNIMNSGSNIKNLPLTSKLISTTNLFDYKNFTQVLDRITTTFNTLKGTIDNLSNQATISTLVSKNKLAQIVNPLYWEEKLNKFVLKFQDIENKFKIKLGVDKYKQIILDKIEKNFNSKANLILNNLSVSEKLNLIKKDFLSSTLESLNFSQSLIKTFMSFLGDFNPIKSNLVLPPSNFRIFLGSIPTPVGTIDAYLDINANLRVDISYILSNDKLATSLVSSGALVLSASAGWNFAVGEVGIGVSNKVNTVLSIATGFEFNNPGFYLWINQDLSIYGNEGLYYKVLIFGWYRVCIGRRWWRFCFNVPTISRSDPRWIFLKNWNEVTSTAIFPYKRIEF